MMISEENEKPIRKMIENNLRLDAVQLHEELAVLLRHRGQHTNLTEGIITIRCIWNQ